LSRSEISVRTSSYRRPDRPLPFLRGWRWCRGRSGQSRKCQLVRLLRQLRRRVRTVRKCRVGMQINHPKSVLRVCNVAKWLCQNIAVPSLPTSRRVENMKKPAALSDVARSERVILCYDALYALQHRGRNRPVWPPFRTSNHGGERQRPREPRFADTTCVHSPAPSLSVTPATPLGFGNWTAAQPVYRSAGSSASRWRTMAT